MVKTNLPDAQTLEKPAPTPVAFHASGGPPLGQAFRRPVSGEWAFRLGPRNWFQSSAGISFLAWASPGVGAPAARMASRSRARNLSTIPSPYGSPVLLTLRNRSPVQPTPSVREAVPGR